MNLFTTITICLATVFAIVSCRRVNGMGRRLLTAGLYTAAGAALLAWHWRIGHEMLDQSLHLITPGSEQTSRPADGLTMTWPGPGPSALISLRELDYQYAADIPIRLTGHGLPWSVWQEWDFGTHRPIEFTPPTPLTGLVDLDWPTRVPLGEPLVITGSSTKRHSIELRLNGKFLIGTETSTDGTFSLSVLPPIPGRHQFDLVTPDDSQVIAAEVIPQESYAIRFDLSRPHRDATALATWMREQGHDVEMNIGLSPAIRQQSDARIDATPRLLVTNFGHIQADDGQSWLNQISAETSGLVLVDEPEGRLGDIVIQPAPSDALVWQESLPEAAIWAELQGEVTPVVQSAGQTVVGSAIQGTGRVLVSTLADTRGWISSGHGMVFESFWRDALYHVLRGADQLAVIADELVPTVGQRTRLCSADADASYPEPSLPVTQRADRDCRDWWPDQSGWHDMNGASVFVYPSSSWQAWRAVHRQRATRSAMAHQREMQGSAAAANVPPWWILILSALVIAWWLERSARKINEFR